MKKTTDALNKIHYRYGIYLSILISIFNMKINFY